MLGERSRYSEAGPGGPGDRSGWYLGLGRTETPGRPSDHPLQPLWGFRGPLRCLRTLQLGSPGGWVVPRYSPPWYPPSPHPPGTTHRRTAAHCRPSTAPGTCTYDRFRPVVGEPRGCRTHLVSGSQTGLYRLLRFTRPFDWVIDLILLNLVPVLLN